MTPIRRWKGYIPISHTSETSKGGNSIPSNIKICILSEYAYPLLTGKGTGFGGAELQMVLLAKELRNRGYNVSFVTFDRTGKSSELIQGLEVYNAFDIKGRGYSYFSPRNLYRFWRVLDRIDADIFIQRAGTPLTGLIGLYSQFKNKVFIFSASSDGNVSDALSIDSIRDFEKYIYKYGVLHSNSVVCQTVYQKELLRRTISKEGKVIRNIYIPPETAKRRENDTKKVLWVKRIGKEKRAELYLELAKENPDIEFMMVGGPSGDDLEYYNKIKEEAESITNLNFIGFVPHEDIHTYYAEASILVNTSPIEGFPNTFLEAWGNYTPVVSLNFDPDGIISKYELGFHSRDLISLEHDMQTLLNDNELREKMGENGRRYVENEHNVERVVDEYEKLISTLLRKI